MREAAEPVVVGPGEGRAYGRAGAWTPVAKATDAQTRGAYALQEMTVAPGFPWSPPHVHRNDDEAMYVLEGACTVRIGERVRALGAGAFALMPRGVVHTFSNPGAAPARVIVISSPGAVVRYFEEAAALSNASPTGQPDLERLAALAKKYGIEFVSPSPG